MTAKRYDRTIYLEQIRVVGGDATELARVMENIDTDGVTWRIEDQTIVLEWSSGDLLTGGSDVELV